MAGSDVILVHEEARAIVCKLEGLHPENPSAGAVAIVRGRNPSWRLLRYTQRMREFAVAAQATNEALIKGSHADSGNAVVAIDDLQRQDQEIREMRKLIEQQASEVNAPESPSIGVTSPQPKVPVPLKPDPAWVFKPDSAWDGK